MKVSEITIKWDPSPRLYPDRLVGEFMHFKGKFYRGNSVVATIPETDCSLELGPGAKLPDNRTFPLASPVYADKAAFSFWDNEEPHTLCVDGLCTILEPGGDAIWTDYEINLGTTLEDWLPASPLVGPPLPNWMGITWPWK